ncbi:unannotated protein [freshwater metagenome]|uniref:Unannotated protein n=1 Tax=freshwater metagenome TaxID=449393 RepID=A0A6J7SGH6_9ZZZZ
MNRELPHDCLPRTCRCRDKDPGTLLERPAGLDLEFVELKVIEPAEFMEC